MSAAWFAGRLDTGSGAALFLADAARAATGPRGVSDLTTLFGAALALAGCKRAPSPRRICGR